MISRTRRSSSSSASSSCPVFLSVMPFFSCGKYFPRIRENAKRLTRTCNYRAERWSSRQNIASRGVIMFRVMRSGNRGSRISSSARRLQDLYDYTIGRQIDGQLALVTPVSPSPAHDSASSAKKQSHRKGDLNRRQIRTYKVFQEQVIHP